MTYPASPESLNKRLERAEWLSHPADIAYFESLVGIVRNLLRDTDFVELPTAYTPFAWRTTFQIYERLKSRLASDQREAQAQRNLPQERAMIEAEWNRYLINREHILDLIRRGLITGDVCEYLGLEPGDLDDPAVHTGDDRFRYGGRPRDWRDRAFRIINALGMWSRLSVDEKRSIPALMAARRAEARSSELAKRVASLEARTKEGAA